ncbi:MAG: diphthamide synthesis protein [Candidatus Pacearchaeota archaeon]
MKYICVTATSSISFSFNKIKLVQLPKSIGLIAPVQFINTLPKLKQFLESHGKNVMIGGNGQVLGCNTTNATSLQDKVQAFLYIGSGKFHPLAIAISLKKPKPIFVYNPNTDEFSRLNEKEIRSVLAKKRTAKIKFLSAKTIGILVSTKPGQNKLKEAEEIKRKLQKQGKKCYIFLFDNFDINQIENFPKTECWINSACPGLSMEHPFIWIDDIK